MILLFTAGGRTGNQLFQLAYAVSNRRKGEWIFTMGFGKTKALLASAGRMRVLNIDNRPFQWAARTFLYPVLYHGLVTTGLASSHYAPGTRFIVRRGRLPWLTVMKGFFESSHRQSPHLAECFRLKRSLRRKVRPIIEAIPAGRRPVFIHIRRSDALSLPQVDGGSKKALPDWYYRAAARMLLERHPECFFIVVGDDPDHAEQLLEDIELKWISRLSVEEDLALMSHCDGGVLSNSTLAWWGAFFSGRGLGCVAPKYWFGWKIKEWHPPEIRASFMTDLIDITQEAPS